MSAAAPTSRATAQACPLHRQAEALRGDSREYVPGGEVAAQLRAAGIDELDLGEILGAHQPLRNLVDLAAVVLPAATRRTLANHLENLRPINGAAPLGQAHVEPAPSEAASEPTPPPDPTPTRVPKARPRTAPASRQARKPRDEEGAAPPRPQPINGGAWHEDVANAPPTAAVHQHRSHIDPAVEREFRGKARSAPSESPNEPPTPSGPAPAANDEAPARLDVSEARKRGWPLISIIACDAREILGSDPRNWERMRGKAPGRPRAGQPGVWFPQDLHAAFPDLIADVAAGANVGLRLGPTEGTNTVALDLDLDDEAITHSVVRRAQLFISERAGRPAVPRIGRPGRSLLLLGCTEPLTKRVQVFTNGAGGRCKVELLGNGQQAVIDGTHACGASIRTQPLLSEISPSDLPVLTPVQIGELMAHEQLVCEVQGLTLVDSSASNASATTGPVDPATLAGDLTEVRALLGKIASPDSRDEWVNVLHALKGATLNNPAEGLELALDWSWCESEAELAETERVWRSITKPHIGIEALCHMAGVPTPHSFSPIEPDVSNVSAPMNGADAMEDIMLRDNPPQLPDAALYGLHGEFVRLATDDSEATKAAVGGFLLAHFAARYGRALYTEIGGIKTRLTMFALIVGPTASGRKGTSLHPVRALFRQVEDLDALDAQRRTAGGPESVFDTAGIRLPRLKVLTQVASGEGLIFAVRDASERVNRKGQPEFEAVLDKRVLLELSEFGGMLAVASREGNTLSAILRDAYDGRDLATNAKVSPVRATTPHVNVAGSITPKELHAKASAIDVAGGLLNRFLPVYSARCRTIANPSPLDQAKLLTVASRLRANVERLLAARGGIDESSDGVVPIALSEAARARWAEIYLDITNRSYPDDALAKLAARSDQHVLIVAALLAAINGEVTVELAALEAAREWVEFSLASTAHIFTAFAKLEQARRELETGEQIVGAVRSLGGATDWVKWPDVQKLLRLTEKGKDATRMIAAAMERLTQCAPARLLIDKRKQEGGRGRPSIWCCLPGA